MHDADSSLTFPMKHCHCADIEAGLIQTMLLYSTRQSLNKKMKKKIILNLRFVSNLLDLSSPANIDIPFGRRQICKTHKYICSYLPTLVASSVECKVLSDPTVHLIQCHFSPETKTHNVILRSHDRYVKKGFFHIANIPC